MMGSVPVSSDGTREPNFQMRDEPVEVRGVVTEGLNLLEENGLKTNEVTTNIDHGPNEAMQAQAALQMKLQKSKVVRWERFLPRRSLKVLLVESDDSTRRVVCGLLCNCGYKVTSASDGLQAWNILVDLTNGIDLILTEVDMPYLSGPGLLSKVMSHKICKHIPVIMMSSQDPTALVLKCLSMGAVDFLVKPVRKNELKILWQHVWRRCHIPSDCDSVNESGIHTFAKVKNAEESFSNNGNENGCIDLNAMNGSDTGSGTQSSRTKRALRIGYSSSMSLSDEAVDPADSTCAQVIHQSPEGSGNNQVATMAKECLEEEGNFQGTKQDNFTGPELEKHNVQFKNELLEPQGEDLTVSENKDKAVSDTNGCATFELSIKRVREDDAMTNSIHDNCNVLRQSNELSNSSSKKVGRCTPIDINSGTVRTESTYIFLSNVNSIAVQQSNVGSNNNDTGSITGNVLTGSADFNEKSTSGNKDLRISSPIQPMDNSQPYQYQQVLTKNSADVAVNILLEQPRGANQNVQVQHHHHHHHYYHHCVDKRPEDPSHPHDDGKSLATATMQCGSFNVSSGPIEGTTGIYSSSGGGSGSGSGSKHGSNTHNGSNFYLNAGQSDIRSEDVMAGKSKDCVGSGSENRKDYTAEAGNKFTQKKEKCFKNKVDNKAEEAKNTTELQTITFAGSGTTDGLRTHKI